MEMERINQFRVQHGDLEAVRQTLGLTKREISELLWVEPSAWTRWSKGISRPPDHIYRALSWYLELCEKNGGPTKPTTREDSTRQVETQVTAEASGDWSEERRQLVLELERRETLSFGWKLVLVVCLAISIFNLLS